MISYLAFFDELRKLASAPSERANMLINALKTPTNYPKKTVGSYGLRNDRAYLNTSNDVTPNSPVIEQMSVVTKDKGPGGV